MNGQIARDAVRAANKQGAGTKFGEVVGCDGTTERGGATSVAVGRVNHTFTVLHAVVGRGRCLIEDAKEQIGTDNRRCAACGIHENATQGKLVGGRAVSHDLQQAAGDILRGLEGVDAVRASEGLSSRDISDRGGSERGKRRDRSSRSACDKTICRRVAHEISITPDDTVRSAHNRRRDDAIDVDVGRCRNGHGIQIGGNQQARPPARCAAEAQGRGDDHRPLIGSGDVGGSELRCKRGGWIQRKGAATIDVHGAGVCRSVVRRAGIRDADGAAVQGGSAAGSERSSAWNERAGIQHFQNTGVCSPVCGHPVGYSELEGARTVLIQSTRRGRQRAGDRLAAHHIDSTGRGGGEDTVQVGDVVCEAQHRRAPSAIEGAGVVEDDGTRCRGIAKLGIGGGVDHTTHDGEAGHAIVSLQHQGA